MAEHSLKYFRHKLVNQSYVRWTVNFGNIIIVQALNLKIFFCQMAWKSKIIFLSAMLYVNIKTKNVLVKIWRDIKIKLFNSSNLFVSKLVVVKTPSQPQFNSIWHNISWVWTENDFTPPPPTPPYTTEKKFERPLRR